MRYFSALSLFALTPLIAQAPELRVAPAARPGERIDTLLSARPLQPFVTLVDGEAGPLQLLDQTVYLGLRQTVVVDSGTVGFGGFRAAGIPVPRQTAVGSQIYLQSFVLGVVNRLFASDGESSVVIGSRLLIVQDFDDPAAAGISGTYDRGVRGRVQAAGVRRRVHDLVPSEGIAFGQAVLGPLNPFGVRLQSLYRATDLGADGESEMLVAIRWKPFGQVTGDVIGRFDIRVAHSHVVPEYGLDPFSGLPRFPDSGLALSYAANVCAGDTLTTIYSGSYLVDPARQQRDGYMPYPDLQSRFEYNGLDSLLLDFAVPPSTAAGLNGQQTYLMVPSSPQPNARALTSGRAGQLVMSPSTLTTASVGECVWHELQLEFLRFKSTALSPWILAPTPAPNYDQPYVAASIPVGASAQIEYRGASGPDGRNATLWSPNIDVADGLQFVQYRVNFVVTAGDLRPSVDQIIIPVN